MPKSWLIVTPSLNLQKELSAKLGITPFLSQILINRGYKTEEQARVFLEKKPGFSASCWDIKGMKETVDILWRAVQDKRRITLYGDYDVDGISGTAILHHTIETLGGTVFYYFPDRLKEGYGLNIPAVEFLAKGGTKVLVCIDSGTTSATEILRARELGMEVLVVDHHEVVEQVPPSNTFINPHQPDCTYPFDHLCASGLCLKVCQALYESAGKASRSQSYFDLAALGTVSDMVPLYGENRYITDQGLRLMNDQIRPGLKALKEIAGIGDKVLASYHLAFILGPRLNAGGRIGDPSLGLRVLLSPSYQGALPASRTLDQVNKQRQEMERKAVAEAKTKVETDLDGKYKKAIVVSDERWHPGVIGLVASRLVESYSRPAVVVSFQLGQGKGSARSVEGFDITQALEKCGKSLVKFGGHSMAAGLSVEKDKLTEFEEAFLKLAEGGVSSEALQAKLRIDAEVPLQDVDARLVADLEKLAPLGVGNPGPLLGTRRVQVAGNPKLVGGDKHIKFSVKSNGVFRDAILFREADRFGELLPGLDIDLVFSPSINRWNDQETVQLEVKDFRVSKNG